MTENRTTAGWNSRTTSWKWWFRFAACCLAHALLGAVVVNSVKLVEGFWP